MRAFVASLRFFGTQQAQQESSHEEAWSSWPHHRDEFHSLTVVKLEDRTGSSRLELYIKMFKTSHFQFKIVINQQATVNDGTIKRITKTLQLRAPQMGQQARFVPGDPLLEMVRLKLQLHTRSRDSILCSRLHPRVG